MKAVFLDRDGTINYGTPTYERVDSVDKVELLPGVLEALTNLSKLEYKVFFVTNQAGLSEGIISTNDFNDINNKVLSLIKPSGINILKTYVCPHGENDVCLCRKPLPGLLQEAAEEFDIDIDHSFMIGDRATDVMTAVNAGARGILVLTGVPTAQSTEAVYTAPSLIEAVEFITNS